MLSSSSKMRNAFCSACCAALCFTLPLASKAELTDAQIQAAFVAALKEYAEYASGDDTLLATVPVGNEVAGEYLMQYLIAVPTYGVTPNSAGIGKVFYDQMTFLFPFVRDILAANTNIASKLHPGHNNREAIQVEDQQLLTTSLQSLDAVERIYHALMMSTSPNGGLKLDLDDLGTNGVDVSDAITHDKLDNIIGLVDELLSKKPYEIDMWVSLVEGNVQINNSLTDIATVLQSSNAKLSDYKQYLEDLVAHTHDLESADQAADSIYNSSYNTAESETESKEETASSDYESHPLASVSPDDYSPEVGDIPDEDSDFADMGFGDQNVGDHNALIRLYTAKRTRSSGKDDPPPIPDIEIDWGQDQAMQTAADDFKTFFSWLYPILGTLFLSAKSLVMFRKCKLASEAVIYSNGHPSPIISLAWDPF